MKSKRVVILQSNYIPWKGYFDLVGFADEMIFLDDVQFTKNDWRNRNRIQTPQGVQWLTVPCGQGIRRLTNEVELGAEPWQAKHFKTLEQNYRKATHFDELAPFLEQVYLKSEWKYLSELNQFLVRELSARYLGIETTFLDSRDFPGSERRQQRVLDILARTGATHYLSGPRGRDYLEPRAFGDAGVRLEYIRFDDYPVYEQLYGEFEHGVSVLDLIFNAGPRARDYMMIGNKTIEEIVDVGG